MGKERKNSPIMIALGVKRRFKKPNKEDLERKAYPKSPIITVGIPIRVLVRIIRKDFPLKLRRAIANPAGIPTREARNVAMVEILMEKPTIP